MERFLKVLPPSEAEVREDVVGALAEDLGAGDPTAALLPGGLRTRARVIAREAAVVCGAPWFDMTFRAFDPAITIEWHRQDGETVVAGEALCTIEGPVRALLSGERTALNFLQTLSGTATTTQRYRERVAGLPVALLDTRKTIPGLRTAQKYAVRCGGGSNHRMGLYDAILIKENHLAACGSIAGAITAARAQFPDMPLEIEVERLDQLREALAAAPDIILLDNFTVEDIRAAVTLALDLGGGRVKLEASGGITLDNLRTIAETGVDRISIGALTKDVRAIDLSMRMEALQAISAE